MKLLSRAIWYYSLSMLFSFMFIGAVLYDSIRHIMLNQVSETLLTEKNIIREQIEHGDSLPDFSQIFKHQIEVTITKHELSTTEVFVDTMLQDTVTSRPARFRLLRYTGSTGDNRGFVIKTVQSIEDEENMLIEILEIIIFSFALLSLLLIVIIYTLSRGLWASFYKTLNRIRQFDFKSNPAFMPVDTKITEFGQLNLVLKNLTDKITSDYKSLKEFSENASHEIQTPVAVIRMNTEQILQSTHIDSEIAAHLASISKAADRISRINQALTLISKIENDQFNEVSRININQKIEDTLVQFHDFILARNLKINFKQTANVDLEMNSDLADFLLNNLIGNAIKHNIENGWVSLELSEKDLTLRNSGKALRLDPEQLFQRFKKAENASDSTGLGLAIVKKVCDFYNMTISYQYAEQVHILCLAFTPIIAKP